MRLAVIIPAAGSSDRYARDLGAPRNKLDEDLGGRPVLLRTVELFTKLDEVASIIVAGPHDEAAFADFRARHADRLGLHGVVLCRGGVAARSQTVAAALANAPADATHVAVHDAARPCTPPDLIERVLAAAARHAAVIPAVQVSDTLKRVAETAAGPGDRDPLEAILGPGQPARVRRVETTVSRHALYAAQTPQVFRADLLRRAYAGLSAASPPPDATDDAGLVEPLLAAEGDGVVVVEGDARNIKITRPADLHMARLILGVRAPEDRPVHKRF